MTDTSLQDTRSACVGTSAGCQAQPSTQRKPQDLVRPPSYVNVPTAVAYAPVPEALLVTMVRVLGLCWRNGYRCTPALTIDQLSTLLDRPRSTLHRHLDGLERELGWLRRERRGRRTVLYPLPPSADRPVSGLDSLPEDADTSAEPAWDSESEPSLGASGSPDRGQNCALDTPPPSELPGALPDQHAELLRRLAEVGIESPARERIAMDPAVKPDWVDAWQLWTQHPARANLSNPAGAIISCLMHRSRPPEPYLRLVRLTPAEKTELRTSYWSGPRDLDPDLRKIRSLYLQLFEDQIRR